MERIGKNWRDLQARIETAAARHGRAADGIGVIAVTKTRSVEDVRAVLACGLKALGENRVQEAEAKIDALRPAGAWHLIGRLQTNKAGKAAALFDVIQSLDSLRLARALERRAAEAGRSLGVFIQVNTSGAAQQGGIDPDGAGELLEALEGMPHLSAQGLMTIGPNGGDETQVRACFAGLRLLSERLDPRGESLAHLSMGMSGDFEWAIAEGATLLRLGTALFGPRPQ